MWRSSALWLEIVAGPSARAWTTLLSHVLSHLSVSASEAAPPSSIPRSAPDPLHGLHYPSRCRAELASCRDSWLSAGAASSVGHDDVAAQVGAVKSLKCFGSLPAAARWRSAVSCLREPRCRADLTTAVLSIRHSSSWLSSNSGSHSRSPLMRGMAERRQPNTAADRQRCSKRSSARCRSCALA